jgi:hypothetical protein
LFENESVGLHGHFVAHGPFAAGKEVNFRDGLAFVVRECRGGAHSVDEINLDRLAAERVVLAAGTMQRPRHHHGPHLAHYLRVE